MRYVNHWKPWRPKRGLLIKALLRIGCVSRTALSEVVTQLTTYSSTEIQAFLTNINASGSTVEHISQHIPQFNSHIVIAWKILYNWPTNRTNWTYLDKIVALLKNSNLKESLNQKERDYLTLIVNVLNNPKTSVKFNNSQALSVYLDAFEAAANKFHAKTGFKIRDGVGSATTNGAVKELTIANTRNLDGGWFGIREMNQLAAENVSRIDWDFDDDAYDCGTNNCQFDVEMVAGQVPRYYEYKSKSMNRYVATA